jgi:hypothetical protein
MHPDATRTDILDVLPPVAYTPERLPRRPRRQRDWWERPAAVILWLVAAGLLYVLLWTAAALGWP